MTWGTPVVRLVPWGSKWSNPHWIKLCERDNEWKESDSNHWTTGPCLHLQPGQILSPAHTNKWKKKHQSHLITFNQILRALYRSDDNLVSSATLIWFISNVLSWRPNKINNCSNNNDNETYVTCVSCVWVWRSSLTEPGSWLWSDQKPSALQDVPLQGRTSDWLRPQPSHPF